MTSPEIPNMTHRGTYFTDGSNVFEVADIAQNYGLAGGTFTTLRDLASGRTGIVDDLHMLVLEEVKPEEADS